MAKLLDVVADGSMATLLDVTDGSITEMLLDGVAEAPIETGTELDSAEGTTLLLNVAETEELTIGKQLISFHTTGDASSLVMDAAMLSGP